MERVKNKNNNKKRKKKLVIITSLLIIPGSDGMTSLFTYVGVCVCVCVLGGMLTTQTQKHMEALPCKLKREGVTEEHGRPWEKEHRGRNPGVESCHKQPRIKCTMGMGCGLGGGEGMLIRLLLACSIPAPAGEATAHPPVTPLQIISEYLPSGSDPPDVRIRTRFRGLKRRGGKSHWRGSLLELLLLELETSSRHSSDKFSLKVAKC